MKILHQAKMVETLDILLKEQWLDHSTRLHSLMGKKGITIRLKPNLVGTSFILKIRNIIRESQSINWLMSMCRSYLVRQLRMPSIVRW